MNRATKTLLALALVDTAAIGASFFPTPLHSAILIIGTSIGLIPLLQDIASSLKAKRLSFDLPILVTILLLLVLQDAIVAAIFVLIVLLGKLFKEYIQARVRASINEISKALPSKALLRRAGTDGTAAETEVDIKDVRKGDILIIEPGSRVPVDSILLHGTASFDESVVTGESRMVHKKRGDALIAGAIYEGDGVIEAEASDISENSTLAQIKKLVEESQTRQAKLSAFTDRYAKYTIVVALLIMAAVFLTSHDIIKTLAIWVALVPVIFAVIVPVSTTIGISILAKQGVLVKHAEALENLTIADTIVFDKTGTLTKGTLDVTRIVPFSSLGEKALLRLAAEVEQHSEHHLGKAIVRAAAERRLAPAASSASARDVRDVRITKGQGISATVGKRRVLIGNLRFMEREGVTISKDAAAKIRALEDGAHSTVFIARERKLLGVLLMADALRDDIKAALDGFRRSGIEMVMLTGDQTAVAESIGRELGITTIYAELMPDDKIRHIKRLQSEGRKVIMVGDGINDAPALAQADVGIAMGLKGIAMTLDAAPVILVNDDLSRIPAIIRSSKKTFTIIRHDLVIATSIHLVTGALVFFNVISILGSAFFHQASSSIVLLNTMRLFSLRSDKRGTKK